MRPKRRCVTQTREWFSTSSVFSYDCGASLHCRYLQLQVLVHVHEPYRAVRLLIDYLGLSEPPYPKAPTPL